MSTLQIRLDTKTKTKAKTVLNNLGLDMSSAVKIYFKQIILRKGIPFQLFTQNGLTWEKENELIKYSSEAKQGKNVTRKMKPEEVMEYLRTL